MADISKIKLPNEAEPRLVKDTEARNIANSKAADAVFIPADPTAATPVEAKRGLVPAPPSTPGTTKFLREDATWAEPAGSGGTSDYDDLLDKPQINSVTLEGNKTAAQLSLQKSIKVDVSGTVTAIADANNDTEFVAGSNVTITGNTSDGTITISATDTTYESKTADSGGTEVSLVTTGEKYTWDNKQSAIKVGSSAVADANHVTTFAEGANVDITAENGTITIAATDTTYSTFDATHAGLAPAGGTTSGFLKNDGSWATPQDTTYTEGTGIDISNANVISNTGVTAVTESNSSTGTNGTISVTTNGTTGEVAVKGLNTAAYKDVDTVIDTANPSTKLPTSAAVNTAITNAINALPEPMVFKGTVSGTYPSTPSVGDTYKATADSNSGVTPKYKAGDTVIYSEPSTGTFEWVVIPSGDEPSGTVTGVTGSDGVVTTDTELGGSTISKAGTVKLALVTNHTTTVNAGNATSTANRSYPLAIDGNSKLAVNVPWENTTYANGSGITIGSGNAINHSNSVTASGDTAAALKVKYDAQGHITGSAALSASDIGLGSTGSAVTGVSTTATSTATGYIEISSYNITTKTLTLKGILAPTASTFVKTS